MAKEISVICITFVLLSMVFVTSQAGLTGTRSTSVDGVWSDWGEPSACSVTCGEGIISYTRECTPPQNGGAECVGDATKTEKCPIIGCPVDGVWSDWGEPSACSVTCGEGTYSHTRECTPPQNGGADCEGLAIHIEVCPVIECPVSVDGVWGDWGEPSACSVTCGDGTLSYTRECTLVQHGGADCEGAAIHHEKCTMIECPVDGVWSDWREMSEFSETCGVGTISYTRVCSPPQHGGADCEGDTTKVEDSPIIECPVDGVWSDWGEPSVCSESCGDGTLSYKRVCSPPENGGADCEGDATKIEDCQIIGCPVDGVWSDWGGPSECSVTCGDGTLSYTRECIPPKHGGADCKGDATHIQECPMIECPVDGVWGDWGEPSACSVTCGEGIISYTRECTPPQHGGAECEGDATQTEDCPIIECPVDGVWSDWGEPSACSVTCGDGTLSYTRECTPPQHGGADCEGDATHIQDCPMIECPVDGVWSDWGEPSACSVTCGEGIISYTRECTPPQNGGAECEGDTTKTEDCPIIKCPVDGVWSDWGEPSACSVTCGDGTLSFKRECTPPQHGGTDCIGHAIHILDCPMIECPVDGVWGDWGEPSACSATCGDGTWSYTRVCSPPQHGGADCEGDAAKVEDCSVVPCPVDGVWSKWGEPSECSVTCGEGTYSYTRECTPPQHGGADCIGDAIEIQDCPIIECPVDGVWSDWAEPSECSETCGRDGILSYTRVCTPPQHGGADCVGYPIKIEDCPVTECPETSMPLTTLIFMRSLAKLVAQGKLSAIPYLDDFLDDPETAESAISIMNGIIELAGTSNSGTHLHFRGHKLRQLCAFKPAEDQMCGLFRPYL